MFDVSFTELLLCFVVALIVLGPQKLPALARTVGRWSGRARGYVRHLTAELDRAADGVDVKREIDDAARALREGAASVQNDLIKLGDAATKPPASGSHSRRE